MHSDLGEVYSIMCLCSSSLVPFSSAKDSAINPLRARFDQRDRVLLRKKHKIIDEETKLENSSPVIENTALSPVLNNNDLPAISTPPLTPVPEVPVAPYNPNTISSINLVTRYFGRKSKTIPSRALKRRYLGPPKTIPCQTVIPRNLSSAASFSSTSVHKEVVPKPEAPEVTIKPEVERTTCVSLKKVKKRGKKSKGISQKIDFLTTDKPYYALNNYSTSNSPLVIRGDDIHVPLWELKPVTSFYQMEGTENINDDVFQRRHMKYELDEKRRKRWDIQRLREQKASEKLKNKYCKKVGKEPEDPLEKVQTLNPDPQHVQYIQFIDQLPVLAFGHLIPLFQPSEFSLTWKSGDRSNPIETIPAKIGRKGRQSSSIPKVT